MVYSLGPSSPSAAPPRMGRRQLDLAVAPGAQLIGFHDANPERSATVSSELGVTSFPELERLLDSVDAVSVVVPTPYHHKVAAPALERGLHVMIEKPSLRIRDWLAA